jgi:hypothetical protein
VGIWAREVFGTQPGSATDTHVLDDSIIDDGQRRAVASAEQHHEPAVEARLGVVLLLFPEALLVLGPVEDV